MGSPPPSRIAPSVVVLLMPPFQRLPAALLFVLRTRTPRPPRPSFASTEGVSAIHHWLLKYSSPLPLPHSPGAAFPGLRLVGPGGHKGLFPHLYNQDTSNDFPEFRALIHLWQNRNHSRMLTRESNNVDSLLTS